MPLLVVAFWRNALGAAATAPVALLYTRHELANLRGTRLGQGRAMTSASTVPDSASRDGAGLS